MDKNNDVVDWLKTITDFIERHKEDPTYGFTKISLSFFKDYLITIHPTVEKTTELEEALNQVKQLKDKLGEALDSVARDQQRLDTLKRHQSGAYFKKAYDECGYMLNTLKWRIK